MAGPALTGLIRQGLRYYFHAETLANFAGGLNLRDAPTELQQTESPDLWNVTLNERGGVDKRLGYAKWNAAAATNLITYGYDSKVAAKLLWYSKADGKLYSDPGTGVLTLRRTWTTGSRISIVDFAGLVYANHPVDGLYSSPDGVTWTLVVAVSGTVPKGDLLEVWQNKLWVAGDTTKPLRLYFSAAGDATKWAAADGGGSNDIREGNDFPIIALHAATPLVVCKRGKASGSTHRVYDSSTGGYTTLDGKVGAASAQAITSLYGSVFVLSPRGIYRTDGATALQSMAERLAPLFTDTALAFAQLDNFCACYWRGRVHFSVTRFGSTVNDLALELHPLLGWIVAGSNAMGCYAAYGTDQETLLGASPTAVGQAYKLNSGGSDDGAAISSWFLTKVFEPTGGGQARMQKLRMLGRGTATVGVRKDFSTIDNYVGSVSSPAVDLWDGGGTWDGGAIWGAPSAEDYRTLYPGVIARAFQVRIAESSTLTSTLPQLLEAGTAPVVGSWGMYGLELQFTPLGLS